MSSTRQAEQGSAFRQERFSSSGEFERGLMANLVAKRCELLDKPEDRELVWFLQLLSHSPGGLEKVADDLRTMFPARVATVSMQKFGFKTGQVYDAEKVKAVRKELYGRERGQASFPVKGDTRPWPLSNPLDGFGYCQAEAERHPVSYPAAVFKERCENEAANLPQLLAELCLDPARSIAHAAPHWFPGLIPSLREFQTAWIEQRRVGCVVTELGNQVHETLDYALKGRCTVLIDGLARTGKTFATKSWCEQRPGSARYVQVPSGTDDIGFYRAIARSLGVSINLNSKAQQLRDRIEDVLQTGQLAVVFDEAHYLWPQSSYRQALPGRINWIMTALVNHQVPVALVTTPQFMRNQTALEQRTNWSGEQFTGRIGHYQKLPDSLSETDLAAVARVFLPEGCAKSIKALVCYAQASAKYLAAIESVARRARFTAEKGGRTAVIFADVKAAIQGSAIPSDTALAIALAKPKSGTRSRAFASPSRSAGAATAALPPRHDFARTRPLEVIEPAADPLAA